MADNVQPLFPGMDDGKLESIRTCTNDSDVQVKVEAHMRSLLAAMAYLDDATLVSAIVVGLKRRGKLGQEELVRLHYALSDMRF